MTAISFLNEEHWFPSLDEADEDGLLAAGGDLHPDRLEMAYRMGIFPWYNGTMPLWWSPDPRFVIFPDEFYVSKSLRAVMRKQTFRFTRNREFEEVMRACKTVEREGQDGTWINDELIESFLELHRRGIAQSFEAWQDGELAGGLYGIRMGKLFFGESMFSLKPNASKAAFVWAVEQLKMEGLALIDCQVYTEHLENFGARFIPRNEFIDIINRHIDE